SFRCSCSTVMRTDSLSRGPAARGLAGVLWCGFSPVAHCTIQAVPARGAIDPALVEWDPWRPEEVARRLARVQAHWYIAPGWAIDLFLGAERREHGDLEIGVPATGSTRWSLRSPASSPS